MQFPADELFWIIGADQIPLLDQWRSIEEMAQLVEFIYLDRPGHPATARPTTLGLKLHRCAGHLIEISSTELRDNLQKGQPVDAFVPTEVIGYIGHHRLYQ